MKIVVTGAAGAIGSHLSERLLIDGHEVIGIDALTPYYDPNIKKATAQVLEEQGVKMHYKNLLDIGVEDIFSDTEAIFHLAAQPGISSTTPFSDYLDNNIRATHRLLEIIKSVSALKALIFASTSSIYGRVANGSEEIAPAPTSYYGVTKLASEQLALSYCREYKLPVTALRFFSVYGERERPEKFFSKLIKSMYEDRPITLHEGSESHIRSYTYVDDIVDGCILALDKREDVLGEIFNLGNDTTITTGEALKIAEELFSKRAKIEIVPKREGDQVETRAQIDKARRILGYDPKVDIKTGLKKQIDWYGEFIHGKF